MKRVLVTGARGFLGGAAARLLGERGWEVVGVSSPRGGDPSRGRVVDLLDEGAVRELMLELRPSHLLHAAWKPVRGDVMRSPDNLAWLKASLGIVQAFREAGGQRAAVIGSSAEYDWSEGICRNNVTPLKPQTMYGAAKHALHVALQGYARATGMSFVWPRVFFVYGPGEHETRLVASVIKALVRGEPAECTHGLQVRDYLHVDDVARGIVQALESEHQGGIDIAAGQGLAVRDLVLAVATQLGRTDLVRLGARPSPVHDAPSVVGDATEAAAVLGWAPRFTLEAGIADTITWGRAEFSSEQSPLARQGGA